MRIAPVAVLLSIVILYVGCSQDCTYMKGLSGEAQCKAAPVSLSKTRNIPKSASCAGVANSRTISINCAAANATSCNTTSNGAGFYALLLPDDGTGSFTDPGMGQFLNCNDLWNSIVGGNSFTNIAAAYIGAPANGESVTCTSTNCTITTTGCFSTWDSVNSQPSGVTASLPATTNYLACVFIDTGGFGPAPAPGNAIPATSAAKAPMPKVTVASPISFSGTVWTDF